MQLVALDFGVGADGQAAAGAEALEEGALGGDCDARRCVIDRR